MCECMRRVAVVVLLAVACAAPKPPPPARRLELAAPDLTGREVDVGAEQGKIRVVDFWATWCEPCKDAMPALEALSRDLAPRGVAVYGISVDEDPALIARFLEQTPVTFPILWDKGGARVQRYDAKFLPVTLIVDRAGAIRHVHQGWDASRPAVERREVEALLREPGRAP